MIRKENIPVLPQAHPPIPKENTPKPYPPPPPPPTIPAAQRSSPARNPPLKYEVTESTKKATTEFIHKFLRELTLGPQQPQSLCESKIKKCFQYQIVKSCCHDKLQVDVLA